MTILARRPMPLRFMGKARLTLGVAAALLLMAAGTWPARAASPSPAARAKPEVATAPAGTPKAPVAKAKPRRRAAPKAAKPAAETTAKPAPAPAAKAPAASDKPTQVVDFDNEQVEGQRMEPGYELIQAAPRRARQPSLVKPLRPEDSVVGR